MIRILIVDDHAVVRRGIKALLAEMEDIQVVGEAANGLEAVSLSKELEPHVILMDLLMPVMDGIEAIRQIIAQHPHMRVLVMISFIWVEEIIPAIKAGAMGYVMQESSPSELIQCIYKVHRGEMAFDPSLVVGSAFPEMCHPRRSGEAQTSETINERMENCNDIWSN